MKQKMLFKTSRPTVKKQADTWDQRNLAVAREFISNPALCGGADSFGMAWALAVIARIGSVVVDVNTRGYINVAL